MKKRYVIEIDSDKAECNIVPFEEAKKDEIEEAELKGYQQCKRFFEEDVIPEKYHIATKAKAAPLGDVRITQIYVRDDLLQLGVEEREINGVTVKIYDKERMLIELLRNKNSMPYDLYKEIIGNYRKIIEGLEIWRIQEYADIFPKSKMIKKALEEEVF